MRVLTVIAAAVAFVRAQSGDACLDQCLNQAASAVGCGSYNPTSIDNGLCICSPSSRWQTFKSDVTACSQSCELSSIQFSHSCNGDTLALPAPPAPSSPNSPAPSSPAPAPPNTPSNNPAASATPAPSPPASAASASSPASSGSPLASSAPSDAPPTSRPSTPLPSPRPSDSPSQTSQGSSSHVGAIVGGVVGGVGGALLLIGLGVWFFLWRPKSRDNQDKEKYSHDEGNTESHVNSSSLGYARSHDNSGSQGYATAPEPGSVSPSGRSMFAGIAETMDTSYTEPSAEAARPT